jgi:hypothetical protein
MLDYTEIKTINVILDRQRRAGVDKN